MALTQTDWWSSMNCTILGLILDLIGVGFLTIDLIRFQLAVRQRGKEGRVMFDELESEYGGIESWASDLGKQSQWVPEDAYSDHHSEGEVSYNTRRAIEIVSELASATNGLAAQVAAIGGILSNNADQDDRLASMSFRFSLVGSVFLVVGFVLQIFWCDG